MAKLVDQLRQLRVDLTELIRRDPEQEVGGPALSLLDAVVSEARQALPPDSSLGDSVVDIVSVEAIEAGDPLRAADALVVIGQLLAVLEDGSAGELVAADRRLYEQFVALWGSTDALSRFLRDHDFGASFRWSILEPLESFCQDWDNAQTQFHSEEVEVRRQALVEAANRFRWDLAKHSGPDGDGWSSVVPAEFRDTFRLDREGKHWAETVDRLNAEASEVYELHQQLVSVARLRLAM